MPAGPCAQQLMERNDAAASCSPLLEAIKYFNRILQRPGSSLLLRPFLSGSLPGQVRVFGAHGATGRARRAAPCSRAGCERSRAGRQVGNAARPAERARSSGPGCGSPAGALPCLGALRSHSPARVFSPHPVAQALRGKGRRAVGTLSYPGVTQAVLGGARGSRMLQPPGREERC